MLHYQSYKAIKTFEVFNNPLNLQDSTEKQTE